MKFKVGDKVRIVDKWVAGCSENIEGKMDKWLGKVMTVRAIENGCYRMEEDSNEYCGGWYWREPCIAGYAFKYEVGQKLRINLRDSSHVGSIIQITNACYDRYASYHYKYIKDTCPRMSGLNGFDEDSLFGRNLVPVEDSKIVIRVDGNKTTACMFENGECVKTATAKCNPSDEFNFETGAKLAFERLFEEKPKFKAGDRVKITCGGEIFRFHETWVKENVYDDDLRLYWAYGQNPYFKDGASIKTDDIFIIKVIADDKAFIQRSGIFETECYVIGLEGIKKC